MPKRVDPGLPFTAEMIPNAAKGKPGNERYLLNVTVFTYGRSVSF